MFRSCIAIIASVALAYAEETPVSLVDAVAKKQARAEFSGNGRDTATLKLTNLTTGKLTLTLAAGTVLTSATTERQLTLRALKTDLAPSAEIDAVLPTAALSSKNAAGQRDLHISAEGEPRLAKLIALFDKQNDLPRPTAQLAVFIALEDLSWPGWRKWLEPIWAAEKPAKPHPTPAEVAQAIDAAAFAKITTPEKTPTLLSDDDFKRLALRNPWARSKAMALYGLNVEDAITGEPSLPPDLGKLLHTAPNDNCPICRQRAKVPEFP